MLKRIIKKSVIAILTIYAIITISFLMVRFMPGDPLMHLVGQDRYYELLQDSPAELERIAQRYGLNDTLWDQYIHYMQSTVTLDFGIAYSNNQPVLDNVLYRAGWTLLLSVPTFIIGGLLGAVLGTIAGWKLGGTFDKVLTPVLLFLNTVPANCIGILFLVVFAFKLGWFPVNGMTSGGLSGLSKTADILWHGALPLTLLILFRTAGNFLLMKSNVSQIRDEEFITTAYSKGLSDNKVLFRHVVKNATLPFVTSLCMQLGGLLSGSMLIEVIFGWKGMGELFYSAVNTRDFPTAQLCFIISAVCIVAGNLLSDILIAAIDPRIKEGKFEY
ncbi:peptide/nickel transport system permease protein [Sporobacter termitidis DSM 10068]|uniref:Peptide/nickel transport system permease protein n=1 Tax=Sporobacter termitidis DSM 10068 TaxID=1123282 RepID=A0A1M5WM13_9FIRM|nr:ABC transporter permease [Sporobacter termitidis]SHH88581.1 peptide/nickel transport system permease protein [Sporobacter termitidis DSM 10068]